MFTVLPTWNDVAAQHEIGRVIKRSGFYSALEKS